MLGEFGSDQKVFGEKIKTMTYFDISDSTKFLRTIESRYSNHLFVAKMNKGDAPNQNVFFDKILGIFPKYGKFWKNLWLLRNTGRLFNPHQVRSFDIKQR